MSNFVGSGNYLILPIMKKDKMFYRKLFQWIMWLIAMHSIGFGIALVVLPIPAIEFFGFQLEEKFFAVQGGIFHIVVSLAYIFAALDVDDAKKMVILSCSAKFMATLFLLSYYIFVSHIFMVVFSGIADFLMGLAILCTYLLYQRSTQSNPAKI
jgi:hypothetical protein